MIDVTVQSGVAVIRMSHGKVNAMDLAFCRSLTNELNQVATNDVRAAILVGNGRVFSAGVDLVTLLNSGPEYLQAFLPALVECFRTLFQFPKPLVAAINGHAIAGGCVMAAACDQRLIQAKARIGIPELRIGVPLPSIAIETLRYAVSQQSFQTMVTIGKTYLGQHAVEVGLADQVVNDERMLTVALELAESLSTIPASVFEITKSQMRGPVNRNAQKNEADFEARVFELWNTDEIHDVISNYVANRL